jgi:hypothetical protein
MIYTGYPVWLGKQNVRGYDVLSMWLGYGRGERNAYQISIGKPPGK